MNEHIEASAGVYYDLLFVSMNSTASETLCRKDPLLYDVLRLFDILDEFIVHDERHQETDICTT